MSEQESRAWRGEVKKVRVKMVFGMILIISMILTICTLTLKYNIRPVRADLPVHNMDTGLGYEFIYEAIDAPETLEGHTIHVDAGTYYEHLVIDKSISLIGEDRTRTVIEGQGAGIGILVTADHVTVQGFGVQNCEIGIKVESNNNAISSNLVSSNGSNKTEFIPDQEIYQDEVSPLTRWFLHNLIDSSYAHFFSVTELTPAIFAYVYGKEDVNHLGIGLFYDENGDDTPQLSEFVGFMSGWEQSVGTFVVDPPLGKYIIKVWGMNVPGDPGHFDMEIVRYSGYGIEFLSSQNSTVSNNLVKSNPIGVYFHNSHKTIIQQNYVTDSIGAIAARDSTEFVIRDNNASMNKFDSGDFPQGIGLKLRSVRNAVISQNNVSSNTFGVWLWNSSNNELINNKMLSNAGWGIGLYLSHENTVHYNNISLTIGLDGIRMMFSCKNNFTKNHFESNNHAGIFLWLDNHNNSITNNKFYSSGQHGVELKFSDNATISDNDIRFNGLNGILIIESTGCTVTRNHVFSNERGIMFYDAFGNKVYHNNIIDSIQQQAGDIRSGNTWDDGYPSGGNYWSDYEDIDEFSGPNQNQIGSDGIWDHPYGLEENVDNYPLVEPWAISSDLNGDGIVNILDISIVALAFDSKPGDDSWNETADLDQNGIVNILDIAMVAKDFGKTV